VGVLSMLTMGCQNKVKQERDAAIRQSREAQAALDEANARLRAAPDPQSYAQLQAENARLQQEVALLQESLRSQPAGEPTDPSLAGIETSYDAVAGTITVNLPGDVLFASGSTEIRTSARATLDKIAAAIKKDYAGKRIAVEGHTDSDPIRRTKDKYDDNFDLAYARAKSVMNYLKGKGIAEKDLVLAAYGPNKPKSSNKAANRRVEIVVHTRS
jgi:flagellar motor protein MotB